MRFASAILLLFLFCAFTDESDKRGIPPIGYKVTSRKPTPSVSKTNSVVVFTFNTVNYDSGATNLNPVKDTILYSHNGVNGKLAPNAKGEVSITLPKGDTKFQFFYNTRFEEVYTDTIQLHGGYTTSVDVRFTASGPTVICDKPVIYVYPETTTTVNIKLNVMGERGFTYPEYNTECRGRIAKGWDFTADTNGTLHINGKEYDYLFWEGSVAQSHFNSSISEGFFVKRDSLVPFFERNLTAMGLNYREQQDFITYWVPLMQKNETSFVHFMFTDEYDSIATINVTPKPDHLFRVFMVWRDANTFDYGTVAPQKIQSVKRNGFTVIEWGGGEIQTNSVQ